MRTSVDINMSVLIIITNTKAHLAKGHDLFFSPEAIKLRDDPELFSAQELAALCHYLKGWKDLTPRYGAKGKSCQVCPWKYGSG